MDIEDIRFFDPCANIVQTRNRLPHWMQPGAACFVTFRLADALPQSVRDDLLRERNLWLAKHPKPRSPWAEREFKWRIAWRIEKCLDSGHGRCLLRQPSARLPLENALWHGEGAFYTLHAWVIMPNHAHVLFSPNPEATLDSIVNPWKSVSARRINRVVGRSGALWQKDYFDRLIRGPEHLLACADYILANPAKAGLSPGSYSIWESDLIRNLRR